MRLVALFVLILMTSSGWSQLLFEKGTIEFENGDPIPFGYLINDMEESAVIDTTGSFSFSRTIDVSNNLSLVLFTDTVVLNESNFIIENEQLTIRVKSDVFTLSEVEIRQRLSVTGSIKVDTEDIKEVPSAFNDISGLIRSLGAVVANNEFSNDYAVRGGAYDENLVYVGAVPVYRPFLIRSAQQDGLSFVNPDLVDGLEFFAGGWNARYGDKLSSVLDVKYRQPKKLEGGFNSGLLGGSVYLGGGNEKSGLLVGARHKNAKYLLNTLETDGVYQPAFSDVQLVANHRVSERWSLSLLGALVNNQFRLFPSSRTSRFGTQDNIVQLDVDYTGEEHIIYNYKQLALLNEWEWTDRHKSFLMLSGVFSSEREFSDVEALYSLCDVDGSGDCLNNSDAGTQFDLRDNELQSIIYDVRYGAQWEASDSSRFKYYYGFDAKLVSFEDQYNESISLAYNDSVVNRVDLLSSNEIDSYKSTVYGQIDYWHNERFKLDLGLRLGLYSLSKSQMISPRMGVFLQSKKNKSVAYRMRAGIYQQAPLYRELRDLTGEVRSVLPQKAFHLIVSRDHVLKLWDRDFVFLSEGYYKYLWDVNPYDLDNVRVRYYAHNEAIAHVVGADFRISGELIKGEQSWLNLNLLSAREDVGLDGQGFIRRPSDQRVTISAFFQDHIPNRPTLKMSLMLVYGSGLPFGFGQEEYRNAFQMDTYNRIDAGFSKLLNNGKEKKRLKEFWVRIEVLNILGSTNTFSYSWLTDVNGAEYAVPNSLSTRFLNIRLIGKF